MINRFAFHPVGQGLFYTGQLSTWNSEEYNFIFDCGSLSGKTEDFLHPAIDDYLKELPQKCIDLCIISHLHSDHYNGLPYLLKNATIKKFVLPYLPDKTVLNSPEFDDNNIKMIQFTVLAGLCFYYQKDGIPDENSILGLKFLSFLYGIDPRRPIEDIPNRPDVSIIFKDPLHFPQERNGLFPYWRIDCYSKVLFEKTWQDLSKKILKELQRGGFENIKDMLNYKPENIKAIAEIYKKVFKQQNPTSIVMKHYPIQKSLGLYPNDSCDLTDFSFLYKNPYHYSFFSRLFGKKNRNISVLTGDAEFDRSLCNNVFGDYSGINVLQLPHHGSDKNWKKLKLPLLFNGKCIASFGLGNSYNHPSQTTVSELNTREDATLIEVNQKRGYVYFVFS